MTEYLLTGVSAWLIPGAGHWLQGHRMRGALLGASLLGLFWAGQALAIPPAEAPVRKPLAVSKKVSFYFFLCQAGNGLSTLVSDALWGAPLYPDTPSGGLDRHLPAHLNLAFLFTSVSGLLNFLLVLHVLDPRSWAEASQKADGQRGDGGPADNPAPRGAKEGSP